MMLLGDSTLDTRKGKESKEERANMRMSYLLAATDCLILILVLWDCPLGNHLKLHNRTVHLGVTKRKTYLPPPISHESNVFSIVHQLLTPGCISVGVWRLLRHAALL